MAIFQKVNLDSCPKLKLKITIGALEIELVLSSKKYSIQLLNLHRKTFIKALHRFQAQRRPLT
jgi:hypothetical protein